MVKNYFSEFSTLFFRWAIFYSEPVIAAFGHQVVVQFLINQHMLGVEIKFPGLCEAIIEIGALLGNPERMFKTDKDSCQYSSKEVEKKRVGLIRPMKEDKEGTY